MNIKKIAYYPSYAGYLKNQAFNSAHPTNVTGNPDRWITLRDFLGKRGIELNTYDMYGNKKEIDLWLFVDPGPRAFKFIFQNRIPRKKLMLMMGEPPVGNPRGWRYFRLYSWLFRIILTWNPELAGKGGKYAHWFFPISFDAPKHERYRGNPKQNLCLMVHSNKTSEVSGELYSFRREVIRYFEKRGDKLLDLYGYGWNDKNNHSPFFSDLYKGTTGDKLETYSKYSFVFCIDNSVIPGYITYDPFLAMATGSVPIYLPMPDSLRYIPADTFVNLGEFKDNLDGLVRHLQSITQNGEYEKMRERGWVFLNSDKFKPFTIENFCEDVYAAIEKMAIQK